jgi:diguanylate cyclase (GGDEF)-like protein
MALVIAGLAMLYTSVNQDAREARANLRAELEAELNIMPQSLAELLVIGDFSTLQQTLDNGVKRADVSRIRYRDTSGATLESRVPQNDNHAPAWFVRWFGLSDLTGEVPAIIGGRNYGKIEVTITAQNEINRTWAGLVQHLLVLLLAIALDFAGIWLVLRSGLKPLRALDAGSRALGSGDFSVRIPLQGCPELRRSIASFNQMAGSLERLVEEVRAGQACLRESQERLAFIAQHDPLTGLPNRVLGRDRLEWAIGYADRSQCLAAVIYIDLDRFKRINDSLGHHVGDALLKAAAARLQLCVRKTDTICRQGGDEFLLILAEVPDPETITSVACSALEHFARSFVIDGRELTVTISLGIAVYPNDGSKWEALFQKAEIAMYSAKEAGRNTYRFFTGQMNDDAGEYLRLRTGLQKALERNELVLHYQPQIDLKSGRVAGVEALLRWNSPELGLVPPGRFIPLAEESGLIVPIGDWVLQEACRQAAAWQREGLPKMIMAVNLSAVQFRNGDVLSSVKQALAGAALDPAYLELELTESILIKDTASILSTVHNLKALGLTLSIDDFGTGYSSLSYLKQFEVDKVKIDQSFVRDITTDANSAAIVNAIVQMARSLGLTTIAEGVEDRDVLEALRQRDCDEVQGYYFARPMPARDAGIFLSSSRVAAV